MPMTVRDILHNADAYRRAHPNYGLQGISAPRITAESPEVLDEEAEQIAREERWS